jgi:hypothetical protein
MRERQKQFSKGKLLGRGVDFAARLTQFAAKRAILD